MNNLERSSAIQKQSPKVLCWKIGTFIGMLAHKNEILAHFWHAGM